MLSFDAESGVDDIVILGDSLSAVCSDHAVLIKHVMTKHKLPKRLLGQLYEAFMIYLPIIKTAAHVA
ncbi:MAG: hypothetical protein NPIRA01_05150 [Nitrospirales bacterium]|nr:MAG: hypothetical protein NPIRA01_05150 [Nitrospirales bacterium]